MPRCAAWRAGAFVPFGDGLIPCSTSERHYRESRRNWPGRSSRRSRQSGEIGPALVLKDPYILDFLGLKDQYIERDFEDAILRELEMFLLELGAGFSFIARQKRIQLDGEDFYIDLLFYNRKLKRLVAVELKQGASGQSTRGRWNSTSAGWQSTRARTLKARP